MTNETIEIRESENRVTNFADAMTRSEVQRLYDIEMKMLREDGIEELDAVITSKNTYIAPFVNAEECEYLVIEDAFPNGRAAWDKGGIIFTDRETVDKIEKIKK